MKSMLAAFASMSLMFAGLLFAQDKAAYPSKPIRIVVGFAPGGGNDVVARLLGTRLQEAWRQPVIIDNKPGANGIIATEFVAKSPADGYTLLMSSSGSMTVNPVLYAKLPYDPLRDFVPISTLGLFPLVLAVHPSVPAKSVQELIAYARANPGKLNYSSASSAFQLATELFKQMAGVDMRHIPYKGSGPAITALVAGDVQLTIVDSPALLPHIKADRVRGLAVTSAGRVPTLPDLPTVAESGLPGYETVLWVGLFSPAGLPGEIVARLQSEVAAFVQLPDVRQRMTSLGIEPVGNTSEALAATIRSDLAKHRGVAKFADLKPE